MKLTIKVKLRDLIYQPYTDSRAEVINIRKKSGADRARSEAKRKLCLEQELEKEGMTWDEWLELNAEADMLYKTDADNKPVIPRHWISGMLVNALSKLPKNARFDLTPDNLRVRCRILTGWHVESQEEVEAFTRAIKNEATNQRRLQTDRVFEDVVIVGSIEVDEPDDNETPDDVRAAYRRIFEFALKECGLGGARKMGYGRGTVVSLK